MGLVLFSIQTSTNQILIIFNILILSQWWRPLPLEVRRWERSASAISTPQNQPISESDVKIVTFVELDEPAGLRHDQNLGGEENPVESPFREPRDPPTKIGWTHAWGMTKWGRKAGPWGQGVDGMGDRKRGGG